MNRNKIRRVGNVEQMSLAERWRFRKQIGKDLARGVNASLKASKALGIYTPNRTTMELQNARRYIDDIKAPFRPQIPSTFSDKETVRIKSEAAAQGYKIKNVKISNDPSEFRWSTRGDGVSIVVPLSWRVSVLKKGLMWVGTRMVFSLRRVPVAGAGEFEVYKATVSQFVRTRHLPRYAEDGYVAFASGEDPLLAGYGKTPKDAIQKARRAMLQQTRSRLKGTEE